MKSLETLGSVRDFKILDRKENVAIIVFLKLHMFSLKSIKVPIVLNILIEYKPVERSLGLSKMIERAVKEILMHSLINYR